MPADDFVVPVPLVLRHRVLNEAGHRLKGGVVAVGFIIIGGQELLFQFAGLAKQLHDGGGHFFLPFRDFLISSRMRATSAISGSSMALRSRSTPDSK